VTACCGRANLEATNRIRDSFVDRRKMLPHPLPDVDQTKRGKELGPLECRWSPMIKRVAHPVGRILPV